VAAFRTAVRLDRSLVDTRFQLAMAQWSLQDLLGAADSLRELLAIQPNHRDGRIRLAIALYGIGDFAGSWEQVHQAEARGHQVPPQFRLLLEAQMPEPQQ
jgi:hypothetical protein